LDSGSLRAAFEGSHQIMEQTMADVTAEQANWAPPGLANPLGATYAHMVISEDMMINGMLKGSAPIMATSFAGKAGVSEPPPPLDQDSGEWNRRVQVDLSAARQYAQAVYKNTSDYISSLSAQDLERKLDLSNFQLGEQTVGWFLANVLLWHVNAHCGEVSCLKGLQGAKGYPF
jgi:hypothetical protein